MSKNGEKQFAYISSSFYDHFTDNYQTLKEFLGFDCYVDCSEFVCYLKKKEPLPDKENLEDYKPKDELDKIKSKWWYKLFTWRR